MTSTVKSTYMKRMLTLAMAVLCIALHPVSAQKSEANENDKFYKAREIIEAKGDLSKAVCDVSIVTNGMKTEFRAVADTGCTVKEPFSSDYVIIAEKELVDNLSFDNSKMRIIPFNSLGGKGILKGYKPDSVLINGKIIQNVYIGICENIIKSEIKAIVPYELVKNCEVI